MEHAVILQALLPVLSDFPLDNNSNSNIDLVISYLINLTYPSGIVKHKALDEDADNVLSMADHVIFGSFLE